MKNHLLKLMFVMASLVLILSSCEKENLIIETPVAQTPEGNINSVTIQDVPFLIPTVQKFNPSYAYLSNPNAIVASRGIADLNLDLEHIMEFVQANGLKTYSITLKKEFEENENYYFENLHIIKVGNDYKYFIIKYDTTEDFKKFDMPTFTGKLEMYDADEKPLGNINFINGMRLIPVDPHAHGLEIGGGGSIFDNDGLTGDPNHSFLWNLLHWIFYGSSWNGNPVGGNPSINYPYNGSSNNSNNGFGNIYFYGNSEYGSVSGPLGSTPNTYGNTNPPNPPVTTTPVPNNPIVIVGNEPDWDVDYSIQTKAFQIVQRLGLGGAARAWFRLPENIEITNGIYWHLINKNPNDEEANSFIRDIIYRIKNSPGIFHSIKPFIIEKNINGDALDPCAKDVLNAIKNSQNKDIAFIIAKLGDPKSVYNTNITKLDLGTPAYITGFTNWTGAINSGASGGGIHTAFNYTVQINTQLIDQGTKLQIYATMIHEIIHAYFLSLIDDCLANNSGCQPIRDLPYVWNQFVNYQNGIEPTITSNISQHNQLATNYVNIIAEALEEYQSGLDAQYYRDLAWGGLQGTIPYENNDPITSKLTTQDRNRIDKISEAEATNQPQSNPSGVLIYFPKGIPCN